LLDAVPAFPGAVGFGAQATGGRGGAVYHVTNLDDSGPGSFRDAVAHTNRIVVFDVGGTIQLNSAVSVASNLTIAGQTAPGDGIAIIGREVSFSNSHNDIVRYVRFRQGSLDPDHGKSTLNISNGSNMILDHVSIEFGQWDNIDVNGSTNITFQNSIIANPIGQRFNAHQDSGNITWYNDVWSSAHNRNPLAKGNTQFVNNVVYNFQAGYTAGNTSGHFSHDLVDNYFITGPSTTNAGDVYYQMANQSVYAAGNYEDSNRDGRLNGSPLGYPGGTTHLTAPWSPDTPLLPTTTADDTYANDIATAGDSLPRDAVDAQVIGDVTSLGRRGRLWTSQTQTGLLNNGYGVLNGGPAIADGDGDGMPDDWEAYYGLDPTQNNARGDFDGTGYTNIEKYINSIVDGSYPYLPAAWADGDVGAVGLGGFASYGPNGFTVNGSGAGVGGTNDQFHFVWQPFSGDGAITAQVTSQTRTDPRAEAGIMFRNSLDDNAAYAEVNATPDGHIFFTWRTNDGGSTSYAVAYAQVPVWLQLNRTDNSFTASYSTDGANWLPAGNARTLNLAPDAVVGLVVSSHDNTTWTTATFANVAVTTPGGLAAGSSSGRKLAGFAVAQVNLAEGSAAPAPVPMSAATQTALRDQFFASPGLMPAWHGWFDQESWNDWLPPQQGNDQMPADAGWPDPAGPEGPSGAFTAWRL
jgi:regulation of enolase protein 1 (concanavalin A-like superfamily)